MNPRKTALCSLSTAHSYQEEKRVSQVVLRFAHQNSLQFQNSPIRTYLCRTSMVVQWLRLQASSTGGTGLIPGQGRSHMPHGVAEQNNNETKQRIHFSGREVKRESRQSETGALPPCRKKPQEWGGSVPVVSPHLMCLFSFCFDSLEYYPPLSTYIPCTHPPRLRSDLISFRNPL